jgi:dTDP-4-amino-4,6-dideoxygalactose transaminase
MDLILDIANRHNLKVIEDAAHSLPASYKGRMVGSLGDITCFSFYATKTLTTGEGGMITTQNSDLAEKMRILSLHGISRDAWKRYTAEGSWRYEILEAGYKYNLSDLQAALGIAQLGKCELMRQRRASIAEQYNQVLGQCDAFEVPPAPVYGDHAWHLYVLRVNPAILGISRDRVIEELKQRGIGSSVHFIPLHLHPLYQQQLGYYSGQFANAEEMFERAISLPIYPGMAQEDIERVVEGLLEIARVNRR